MAKFANCFELKFENERNSVDANKQIQQQNDKSISSYNECYSCKFYLLLNESKSRRKIKDFCTNFATREVKKPVFPDLPSICTYYMTVLAPWRGFLSVYQQLAWLIREETTKKIRILRRF